MRPMTVTARLTSSYYSRGCHRVAAVNQSSKSRWVFCVDCLDWGVGRSYAETKSLYLSLSHSTVLPLISVPSDRSDQKHGGWVTEYPSPLISQWAIHLYFRKYFHHRGRQCECPADNSDHRQQHLLLPPWLGGLRPLYWNWLLPQLLSSGEQNNTG